MAPLLWVLPAVAAAAVAFWIQKQQQQLPEHAVYVIGDLHGDVECAKFWVHKTNLISSTTGKWNDDSSKLVFMGDYIDKGITSKQVVEYVKSLTEQYPSRVTAILGNHEMELLKDRSESTWGPRGVSGLSAGFYQLGYSSVHPGEYLNYLDDNSIRTDDDELVIDALYNASMEVYSRGLYRSVYLIPHDDDEQGLLKHSILQYVPPKIRSLVKERLKVYQDAYLDAYRSQTTLGDWLEQRPVAAVIDGTLFVHGGLSPEVAQLLQQQTSTHGAINRLNDLLRANANEAKLNTFLRTTPEGSAVYNMLVYRGNHKASCETLQATLRALPGIDRIAVGHTPAATVRLRNCSNDNDKDETTTVLFLALDSALGRWFRNSGNEYCPGHRHAISSNGQYQCRKKEPQCQGQIVKIVAAESKNGEKRTVVHVIDA